MPLDFKFRKEWKLAGYARGHGSDAVLPPAKQGFKRLYYLTGLEHGISNIVFNRVKISRFSELNDPFELLAQNFGDAHSRRIVKNYRNDLDKRMGLVCFSEDWVDPVLWSHYAQKHKGIALGFDVDETTVGGVIYSDKRISKKIPLSSSQITPSQAKNLAFTKFDSWEYEREWRMLIDLKNADKEGRFYFNKFSSSFKLTEVILGPLCESDLVTIRKLVDSHHRDVKTYSARLALRSFRIIPKGNTVPQ